MTSTRKAVLKLIREINRFITGGDADPKDRLKLAQDVVRTILRKFENEPFIKAILENHPKALSSIRVLDSESNQRVIDFTNLDPQSDREVIDYIKLLLEDLQTELRAMLDFMWCMANTIGETTKVDLKTPTGQRWKKHFAELYSLYIGQDQTAWKRKLVFDDENGEYTELKYPLVETFEEFILALFAWFDFKLTISDCLHCGRRHPRTRKNMHYCCDECREAARPKVEKQESVIAQRT